MTIVDVKTICTDDDIYEYIVTLDDGRYAMFDDDDLGRQFVRFVDREPTGSDWRTDFFDRHNAGYLDGEDADDFMVQVLYAADLTPAERLDRIFTLSLG